MKAKEILKVAGVSVLTMGLFGAALVGVNNLAFATAASGSTPLAAAVAQELAPPVVSVQNAEQRLAITESTMFVPPNVTILESMLRGIGEQPSENAMPREEAVQVGAQYIWDTFGVSIDGLYVSMTYSQCFERAGKGIWMGMISLPVELDSVTLLPRTWGNLSPEREVPPARPQVGETVFHFTIDSVTGERMSIQYNTPRRGNFPRFNYLPFNRFEVWSTEEGQAVRNMDDCQLAEFIGLSSEQIEVYRQEAIAFAMAHFINAKDLDIRLGATFQNHNPTIGMTQVPGINIRLDKDASGNIFGVLDNIDFTATDENGNEAIISMRDDMGYRSISVRSVFPLCDEIINARWNSRQATLELYDGRNFTNQSVSGESVEYFQARTIPEHLREMWEADDAEVSERFELNRRGVAADDFPAYGLWTRWELLDTIRELTPIEKRHMEMSRNELVERTRIGLFAIRSSRVAEYEWETFFGYDFFEWVRNNYNEETIAIYEEMGSPQWLIDRLRREIADR